MESANLNDGLAFSNPSNTPIGHEIAEGFYEGIENDIFNGFNLQGSLDRTELAKQGVLLYNTTGTISHVEGRWEKTLHERMWKPFSDYVIKYIAENYNRSSIYSFWKKC